MLCTPVFIFTSGSSALLGCPRCDLLTLFWVNVVVFFHEKMDKTGRYWKPYENSRWWLLGAQSILKYWESLFKLFYEFVFELEGFGELQATKLWGQRERGIQQKMWWMHSSESSDLSARRCMDQTMFGNEPPKDTRKKIFAQNNNGNHLWKTNFTQIQLLYFVHGSSGTPFKELINSDFYLVWS